MTKYTMTKSLYVWCSDCKNTYGDNAGCPACIRETFKHEKTKQPAYFTPSERGYSDDELCTILADMKRLSSGGSA